MPPLLRTPKWLAGHALAAAAVVAFVLLGMWQLSRLEERREHNAQLDEQRAAVIVSEGELATGDADSLAYRRTEVRGEYVVEDELLLSTRSLRGTPGHHVLTPLRLPGGGLVLVDRGWIPFAHRTAPVQEAAPPGGTVTLSGVLLPSEPHGRVVEREAGSTFATGVDLEALQPMLGTLAPVYLLAQQQDPPPGDLPVFGAPPEPAEGSHRSYAVQWFLFAGVVMVGYPLLLRRALREDSVGPDHGESSV